MRGAEMENKETSIFAPPALLPDERGRTHALLSAWLIPRVPPPWPLCALAALIAVAAAVLMRVSLLGLQGGVGATQPFFPAVMLVTLYAGWRWGLIPVIAGATFGWWLWGGRYGQALAEDELATMVIYLLCAVMVTAVGEGLRSAIRGLTEAREALAETEDRLRVTQTAAGADARGRGRAEDQMRESEARFRNLADSAPALMWVSRPGGVREFVNQAYVAFTGLDDEAALSMDWRTRLYPEDLPGILKAQVQGEASRKPFALEARYRRADGQWRWLKSFSQPRFDADGGFLGFIGIAFDTTDAKLAEKDLTRLTEMLEERVAATVAERDAAQAALMQAQKLEAIGQLTGGVAHDFNNLLTVIIGALDAVERHPDDARRRERMLTAAAAAAKRGEKLTQHLLAFARRQPLKPEVCRIDRLVAESESLLRRALGDAYGFNLRLGAGVRSATIDAGQFEAALLNLVVNARDATAPGGQVTIESHPLTLTQKQGELEPGEYLRISVRDTGMGMDAATLARAVEPFFTTKAPGEGTGLGLSQVYGFARQSGGGVEIQSQPGQGAVVSLLLPEAVAVPIEDAAPRLDRIQAQTPARVLLVEDDPQVAELIDAMLADLGHTVVRAGGVDEALARLDQDEGVQLVLSDVIMPGGRSGVDLAEQLAATRPGLPVVLCSGYTGGDQGRARAGDWPFVSKPFSLETLARALTEAQARVRPH
ncbi:ATP-binding protein [Caulobacter sp.]|uniref:ATP-binding protein n=1 Tax=Caulobacter sp. TaxID=78 RepID=UPI00161E1A74